MLKGGCNSVSPLEYHFLHPYDPDPASYSAQHRSYGRELAKNADCLSTGAAPRTHTIATYDTPGIAIAILANVGKPTLPATLLNATYRPYSSTCLRLSSRIHLTTLGRYLLARNCGN